MTARRRSSWEPTVGPPARHAAAVAGAAPTGHGFPLPNEYGEAPANVVIEAGETSLEEMIASTERGILVTRFSWCGHPGEESPDMVVPAMKVRDFNFTEVTRF